MSAIDYNKRQVKKILKEYEPGDDQVPVDAPPIVKIPGEVADQLILRAISTGAKIVFVNGETLLKEAAGVGSVLRYNMNATASG